MIKIGKGNFTKGNFTVECAMIMPIILMCIISVLWLMIYMYNANIMYRALIHAVSAADYHNSKNNTQLKNEVEDRIYEDINGQLVGIKDGKVNVKVGKNSVTASIEGNLEISESLPGLSNLSKIKAEVKKTRMHGADIILSTRKIKALYDALEGMAKEGNTEEKEEK